MRILVVDDDRGVGEALVILFSQAGHQVSWAADGASALALLPADVVLLDLYLAEGPSVELVPLLGGARIYVITAGSPPSEMRAAIARSGAAALLFKSIDPGDLLARVERG